MPPTRIPRGIWYEAPRKRWRVRLYQNKQAFLIGYFTSYKAAHEAWLHARTRLARKQAHTQTPTKLPTTLLDFCEHLAEATHTNSSSMNPWPFYKPREL